MISNLKDLYFYFGGVREDTSESEMRWHIERMLYKTTYCGAWINMETNKGIEIGSIVEGSDIEIVGNYLAYPFKEEELEKVIEHINAEACEEWEIANNQPTDIEEEEE